MTLDALDTRRGFVRLKVKSALLLARVDAAATERLSALLPNVEAAHSPEDLQCIEDALNPILLEMAESAGAAGESSETA